MKTPILFLIFNRPQITVTVFETIKAAKPQRLYIAADGPRRDREGEFELCVQTRQIIDKVDWPCEVKTLFRDNNLGCKKAVNQAISCFFDNEQEGIILEDDILPHPDFFKYCEDLLNKYRDDTSIGIISRHNHVYDDSIIAPYSYDFVVVSHCWGWASWRRSWKLVDVELSKYTMKNLEESLSNLYKREEYRLFWKLIFFMMKHKKINSWAYPMTLSFIINNKLSIIPAVNLTKI